MAQDMANKKKERNKRNNSGTNTDRQAQVARGGKDDSNKRNKLRAAVEKKSGKKVPKGKDVGHKKSLKSGGSSEASNAKIQSKKKNRSEGGKMGNKEGKARGGAKSSRKGIKNK